MKNILTKNGVRLEYLKSKGARGYFAAPDFSSQGQRSPLETARFLGGLFYWAGAVRSSTIGNLGDMGRRGFIKNSAFVGNNLGTGVQQGSLMAGFSERKLTKMEAGNGND